MRLYELQIKDEVAEEECRVSNARSSQKSKWNLEDHLSILSSSALFRSRINFFSFFALLSCTFSFSIRFPQQNNIYDLSLLSISPLSSWSSSLSSAGTAFISNSQYIKFLSRGGQWDKFWQVELIDHSVWWDNEKKQVGISVFCERSIVLYCY